MSEANRDQPPTFIEGELSLDDLSQIAGGTGLNTSDIDSNLNPSALSLPQQDSMFTAVGAKGSEPNIAGGYTPMNLSLAFP